MEVMDMEDMVMEVTMVREMLMLSQVMVMPPATLTDPHRVSLSGYGGYGYGGYGYGGYYGKRDADAEPGYGYATSYTHRSPQGLSLWIWRLWIWRIWLWRLLW